jgi:hypothetical protein
VKAPQVYAACPHLPDLQIALDYRELRRHEHRRDGDFYFSALCYAQHLWRTGHAGRALLALTRALYADLSGDEPNLHTWPLPYAAFRWIIEQHHSDDFPGNPRLSFQHQACRIRGPRREIRSARAWALWALVCRSRPHLPGDPACLELEDADIAEQLEKSGLAGEVMLWKSSMC